MGCVCHMVVEDPGPVQPYHVSTVLSGFVARRSPGAPLVSGRERLTGHRVRTCRSDAADRSRGGSSRQVRWPGDGVWTVSWISMNRIDQ